MQIPQAVKLENDHVLLTPLSHDQAEDFFTIGQEPSIWSYLTPEPFSSVVDAEAWITDMSNQAAATGSVSWAVFDKRSGQLAGSTSFLDVRLPHGGVEIGFTWYGVDFQRSHVNTATKLVLFSYAFDRLGANRVQLQTDARNTRSQTAISRLGATKEGVLRKHKVYPNGYVRDSVMFSVTMEDWPDVQRRLRGFLTQS